MNILQPDNGIGRQPPLSILAAIHGGADAMLPFAHALRLALGSKGVIEIIDVRKSGARRSDTGVRKLLERWGVLPKGSRREDVDTLGLRVKKIVKPGHAKKEISKRLEKSEHDLLVIGTCERKGIAHLFSSDLVEHLANKQRQTTLYIPDRAKPFVNIETGALNLHTVLVPIAVDPPPESSFVMVQRLSRLLNGGTPLEVIGMHVGDMVPYVSASVMEDLSYRELTVQPGEEPVANSIASAADREKVDLIVMATNGRDTIAQHIVGSVTEQVLRKTPCPVLAVAVE